MKKRIYTEFIMVLCIFVSSIILLLLLTNLNPNIFYSDDNAIQWEPIMKGCFDRFFKTGEMPYIDFYQYKKMDVLGVGYYSINNPLMFVAYLVSKYIFDYKIYVTCVYTFIMFALGNASMYLLLMQVTLDREVALISVLMYTSFTSFMVWGFYYFTFSTYFFIPFFLLILFKSNNLIIENFSAGIVLAFSLLLGQVQYTFYYYMLYGIIMIIMFLKRGNKYFRIIISNIFVSLLLIGPHLLMLVRASANRSLIITENEFLALPVSYVQLFSYGLFPYYFLRGMLNQGVRIIDRYEFSIIYLGMLLPLFLIFTYLQTKDLLNSRIERINKKIYHQYLNLLEKLPTKRAAVWESLLQFSVIAIPVAFFSATSPGGYIGILIILLSGTLISYYLIRKTKSQDKIIYLYILAFPFLLVIFSIEALLKRKFKKNQEEETFSKTFIFGVLYSAIVFIIISIGKYGVLSLILRCIPVINEFRYLYKWIFVFIPLMVVIAGVQIQASKQKRNQLMILCTIFSIVGLINTWAFVYFDQSMYYNNTFYQYNSGDIDYNEVIEKRFSELSLDKNNYRFLAISKGGNIVEISTHYFHEMLTKNNSTSYHVFTLAGYDNAFSYDSYLQSDALMTHIFYDNMFTNSTTIDRTFNVENSGYPDQFYDRIYYQINNNAVKYFLINKDNEEIDLFYNVIERMPEVNLIRVVPFVGETYIFEIDGMESLCKSDLNELIDLESEIDELTFRLSEHQDINYVTLSFTYDEYYKAYFIPAGENQREIELAVEPDTEKYTKIQTGGIGAGTVRLVYENSLCDAVMVNSLIATILMIVTCVIIGIRRKRPDIPKSMEI